jgi:preprotein translocase subunit SecF
MRFLANPNFNFIRWRWHALVLSVLVIGSGIATVIARGGLPLGVDFSGGTVIIVQFTKPTSEETVRSALGPLSNDAVVQRYQDPTTNFIQNAILIRLPLTAGPEQANSLSTASDLVETSLKGAGVGEFKVIGRELVGPTIGQDLKRKGIWATLTAIGGILVYIGFRFRFGFAVGAVVATFHDILVTLAFLTWFGYDLSLNVVAAILTITGYSVNDTIVIFDRVRENQRLMRREPLEKIVNQAVNQTLSRTIITAGATFLAVIALYLFGGAVLHGFAFTMLVGIITGTYSTVFIAAAIAIILSRRTTAPTQQGAKPVEARRRRA